MKIAVIGATGLVGHVMLKVLNEFGFGNEEIFAVASSKSVDKEISFAGRKVRIISIEKALDLQPDYAIFSAGSSVALQYAPKFAEIGATVIDNSSAFRKFPEIPLVVPEINANILTKNDKIIANPNCSTIQMVLALSGLHKRYKIKRIVVSTYQSVTGTGVKAVEQLQNEQKNISSEKVYPHPIHENLFPHGGTFLEDGYTTEEQKLLEETRKILGDEDIQLTATVVRVPVLGGHSEAVNVEFYNPFQMEDVINILQRTKGIVVQDFPRQNVYPTPLHAAGKNEVFVGRIRKDLSQANSLNLWIVADNLRKGAATNAIQILQYLTGK